MSDVDRLLEAAEWLDNRGHRGEEPDRASESWAEAALLRAAADLPGWWSPFDVAYPSDAVRAAALALADTILGSDQ